MGACARTGQCCELIMLDHSPRLIRESYENWKYSKPNTVQYQDIELMYPMLAGRCKGKKDFGGTMKYIYGPCRNFDRDEKGLPLCAIHQNKPRMCSGYPHYQTPIAVVMNTKTNDNPGWFRGCGFNSDPSYGGTLETMALGIQPLTDEEK